jgi:hypothetical protein
VHNKALFYSDVWSIFTPDDFLVGGELLQPEIIYSSSLEVVRKNRALYKKRWNSCKSIE